MSTQRILSLCLGLSVLVLFGCSSNSFEPQPSVHTGDFSPMPQTVSLDEPSSRHYFPLHVGDRWIYVASAGRPSECAEDTDPQIAEFNVTSSFLMEGRQVYEVKNYMFPFSHARVQFCNEYPGQALEVVGDQIGLWYPWSQFGCDDVSIAIPELGDDCVHGSEGKSSGLSTVTVPAGTFQQTATVYYDSHPCMDFGLAREVFAPGVGLIERVTTGIPSEVTWRLVYASVGGRTWGTPPKP